MMNAELLDVVKKYSESIDEFVHTVTTEGAPSQTISVDILENREKLISELMMVSEQLNELHCRVRDGLKILRDIQSIEIGNVDAALNKLRTARTVPAIVAPAGMQRVSPPTIDNNKSINDKPVNDRSPNDRPVNDRSLNDRPWVNIISRKPATNIIDKVFITEKLYLEARIVKSFANVINSGEIYYVETAGHFAVKIFDILLHGNIGTIYTSADSAPVRITSCKYGPGCKKNKCEYYHDPAFIVGSKDVRNYLSTSWIYTNPTSLYNSKKSRRFGSLANLDADIITIADDEIDRYADQAMHDLLCTILLKKYYKVH